MYTVPISLPVLVGICCQRMPVFRCPVPQDLWSQILLGTSIRLDGSLPFGAGTLSGFEVGALKVKTEKKNCQFLMQKTDVTLMLMRNSHRIGTKLVSVLGLDHASVVWYLCGPDQLTTSWNQTSLQWLSATATGFYNMLQLYMVKTWRWPWCCWKVQEGSYGGCDELMVQSYGIEVSDPLGDWSCSTCMGESKKERCSYPAAGAAGRQVVAVIAGVVIVEVKK